MKIASLIFIATLAWIPTASAETVADIKNWAIEGYVQMDPAKPGPGGAPSIKVDPKSKAVLKLRPEDGAGKLTLSVYDDGTVGSPGKVKAVGPRWGLMQSNGRVLVGAIMYARFLQENGSLCLIDTDPSTKGAWAAMKFLSPRSEPGWRKWEFEYEPTAGLRISYEGKPLTLKQFDWNQSQATGFNGLVLYGDETGSATAQTLWISDINYELSGPMKVAPTSSATPSATATPTVQPPAVVAVTQAEIDQAVKGVPAKMTGFTPEATLADDLKGMTVPLLPSYTGHPRLLFSGQDKALLMKKAEKRPELWNAVISNSTAVKSANSVPAADLIKSGAKYWMVERIQSGALAWFVTGDAETRDGVKRWMLAHAKEPVWGTLYRPNLDLAASWYLYHMAVGYDILWSEFTDDERKIIREGLISHARAIFADHDPANTREKIRYDQNHTYIPIVALTAASLVLADEVPEARVWLNRSYAILRRCRYVLGNDGYYHEGVGYWTYALHWHVRGAELLTRATGEKLLELPALSENWRNALHLSLPGSPGLFDIGDAGGWKEPNKRPTISVNNYSMLWAIASANNSPESQAAAEMYHTRKPEKDYPATAFLWYNPEIKPAEISSLKPYHYFADHGLVTWRSGWDADATSFFFRCGPSLGHGAAPKVDRLKDWTMNTGHVHPDVGAFLMYAKGAYMVVDTGYLTLKRTADHNTLLINGKGQGKDGTYWYERDIPYKTLDETRITREYLSLDYGFVSGDFGSLYQQHSQGVSVKRSLLMTKNWLLVIDDMTAASPQQLTWLCHADAEFKTEGSIFLAKLPKATLAVLPLTQAATESKMEPTVVSSGLAPGQEIPQQRGFRLALSLQQPAQKVRMVNLLVPLGENDKAPLAELVKSDESEMTLRLKWPDNTTEDIQLNLSWQGTPDGPQSAQAPADKGPATVRR
ncbi:MAG TPA: heparinase II/III family protein [Candidatus Methylacidiphilales bacterium]|nr:heparinase II/III family protein [Candidatus Methylacidiphilales bacterium]